MNINVEIAVAHLDDVLAIRKMYGDDNRNGYAGNGLTFQQEEDLYTAYVHALERCAPPGSVHHRRLREITKIEEEQGDLSRIIARLEGVVRALRRDWCSLRVETFTELVHCAMFSEMLEAAAYLFGEGFRGPAAVMAGAVLEQHVRKLCEKNAITTTTVAKNGDAIPKKMEAMNAELATFYAGGKQDQKEVTTLAGLRNHAAHGEFDKFDDRQVDVMIQSIRGFINRNPA